MASILGRRCPHERDLPVRRPRAFKSIAPARLLAILIAVVALCVAGCTPTLSIGAPSKSHHSKHHSKQHGKKSHRTHHAHGHPKHHAKQHRKHQAKQHLKAHSHKSGHAAPAQDTLAVEPNAGFGTVYSLINHARHSIDVTMYEFADTTAEHDLAAAAKRGVQVRVILDQKETSVDTPGYDYFKSHGIKVVWSWSKYTYTHQKTLTFDNSVSVVQTANLTANYYKTSRDFLVVDRNAADVAAIVRVFNADFAHKAITPGDGHDLVWSPTDSQRQILGLINSARKSLRIYSEEMADTTVIDALISAAKRGVDVSVCGENADGEYTSTFEKMARAGVHIAYFSSSTGFYIHGKVIEADYGRKDARVFIGSENFSSTSLNDNRELGLIISTPSVLSGIARVFATDFAKGTHPR
jgi:cardiolipin synthase